LAYDGRVDFSQRNRSTAWHIRLLWLLEEDQRRQDLEYAKIRHKHAAAFLAMRAEMSEGTWNKKFEELKNSFSDSVRLTFGLEKVPPPTREQIARQGKDAWESKFGNMQDPAVQAKIRELADALFIQGKSRTTSRRR